MSHNLSSTTEENVTVLNYIIPLVEDDMQGKYTDISRNWDESLYKEVSFIWRLKCSDIVGIGTS